MAEELRSKEVCVAVLLSVAALQMHLTSERQYEMWTVAKPYIERQVEMCTAANDAASRSKLLSSCTNLLRCVPSHHKVAISGSGRTSGCTLSTWHDAK
jgi:hypothetical protein